MIQAKLLPVKSIARFHTVLAVLLLCSMTLKAETAKNLTLLIDKLLISDKQGSLQQFPFSFDDANWVSTVYEARDGSQPTYYLNLNYSLPEARIVIKGDGNQKLGKLENGDYMIITNPEHPLSIQLLSTRINIMNMHQIKGMDRIMPLVETMLVNKQKTVYGRVLMFQMTEIDDEFTLRHMYQLANLNPTILIDKPDFLDVSVPQEQIDDKVKYFHNKTKGLAAYINKALKPETDKLEEAVGEKLDAMTQELDQYLKDANADASEKMKQLIEQRLAQINNFIDQAVLKSPRTIFFNYLVYNFPQYVVNSTEKYVTREVFIKSYIDAFMWMMQHYWVDVNNVRADKMAELTKDITQRLTDFMTQLYQQKFKDLKGLNDKVRTIKKQVEPLIRKIFNLEFIREAIAEKIAADLTEYSNAFFDLTLNAQHALADEERVYMDSMVQFYSLINGPYIKSDNSNLYCSFRKIDFFKRLLI